jgi:glycogen phosphorylase
MNDRVIAYFSMEIAIDPTMPTYSGGLGVLAGDTVRSAADLKVPMVAVTLLHRKGYFRQKLDANGWQTEEPDDWKAEGLLEEARRVSVTIEGREVQLRAWKYEVKGISGATVPVFLLDSQLPENSESDRTLTDTLYGGDARYRLCQEIILGIGGLRMLRAMGCKDLKRFHMNEGHASLLTLELLDESMRKAGRDAPTLEDVEAVSSQCVFTTHTPVPAGHDRFPMDLVRQVLARHEIEVLSDLCCFEGMLNMTLLALNLSRYVNGVAKKHAEVSRSMFVTAEIDAITNGVHAATCACPAMQELFDRHIAGWREDNFSLRVAMNIPRHEIWEAHIAAKRALLDHVREVAGTELDLNTLTLGFARRAAAYKRADLLIQDIPRLKRIAEKAGRLQVIYAGKAHPQDQGGKELIQRIIQSGPALEPEVKLIFLANYDLRLARLLTGGVDVWLNTPQPPMEASGTSGMKAALNGVPNLSVLDGWWLEGWIEGRTGWAIGEPEEGAENNKDRTPADAESLYQKLELVVLPIFYRHREEFLRLMRHSIALNGSYFNTQRMVLQYVLKAYFV